MGDTAGALRYRGGSVEPTADAAVASAGGAQPLATIMETFFVLEWIILTVPFIFHGCRYFGVEWAVKPELWCLLGFGLVVALAVRERLNGVGAELYEKENQQRGKKLSVFDKLVFHCTSTQCGTDRHKPQRSWVKGASCLCFLFPAIDLYCFAEEDVYERFAHEVPMLVGQCIMALMADHVMCGIPSAWHPADRVWAGSLTLYGIAKPIYYGFNLEDTITSWLAVATIVAYFPGVSRRHHGLPTHHVQHALFHVVACAAWNYAALAVSYQLL